MAIVPAVLPFKTVSLMAILSPSGRGSLRRLRPGRFGLAAHSGGMPLDSVPQEKRMTFPLPLTSMMAGVWADIRFSPGPGEFDLRLHERFHGFFPPPISPVEGVVVSQGAAVYPKSRETGDIQRIHAVVDSFPRQ